MTPQLRTASEWGFVPTVPTVLRRGFGSQQSAQQGVMYGSAAAGSAAAIASAAGLIPVAAVPFIGPALAGVTLLASALIKNSGCGQTCIVTSEWANKAAEALQQNLDAYKNGPRTKANQQLALSNFDAIWGQLVKMCGDPQWGDAGKRCISDRQQGACVWKDNGQCWNWFVGYRDPIANDTSVAADSGGPVFGGDGGSLLPLLGIAALVALGVML